MEKELKEIESQIKALQERKKEIEESLPTMIVDV